VDLQGERILPTAFQASINKRVPSCRAQPQRPPVGSGAVEKIEGGKVHFRGRLNLAVEKAREAHALLYRWRPDRPERGRCGAEGSHDQWRARDRRSAAARSVADRLPANPDATVYSVAKSAASELAKALAANGYHSKLSLSVAEKV